MHTYLALPLWQAAHVEEAVDDPEEVAPPPPKKSLSNDWKESEETGRLQSEIALNSRKASITTNIKRDMALYESSGNKGKILEQIYTALLSIPATSVEVVFNQLCQWPFEQEMSKAIS